MAPEQLDNLLERDPLYIKELWGWGAAGAVVMLLRFTVRLRIVGYKGFQGDDFFMIMILRSIASSMALSYRRQRGTVTQRTYGV
ncbi:hypothetical protein NW760_015259 [Fusarium oxysporum]|nr:hypothetical protein NW760_015259 [Fusarium oxysporum]